MATNQVETQRRELNPQTEAALPAGPIPLLEQYEAVIGTRLAKLPKDKETTLERTGGKWGWSWTPQDAAMFLQSWDNQVYMASPLLRELAMTPDPSGGGFLYERFCKPPIVEAIRSIQIMYDKPLGKLRPVPRGNFSIDLRQRPPGRRPTKFRINDWEFYGLVQNIPEGIRNQLARMHSLWMERELRVNDPIDHEDVDLGAVNAPARRGQP